MIISVHQPQYIPWLGYFDKIAKSDGFVFLDQVQYKEREFQNRNKIRTKDGWLWLTVPVISKGFGRQNISDVKIDNELSWQDKTWGSLRSCYNRAPFFKEHAGFFEKVYTQKWVRLIDLNIHIIEYLLAQLKIETPLYYESKIGTTLESTGRIIEICKKLKADTYLSGSGGKDYLEEEKFKDEFISLQYQHFIHPAYRQQYLDANSSFLPYMSAIDLLFNEGQNSVNILKGKPSNV